MDKTRRVKGGGPIVSDPSLASVIIEAGKQPNLERWGGSGAARTASTWKKPGRKKSSRRAQTYPHSAERLA